MVSNQKNKRLTKADWIRGALEILGSAGKEGVKIVPLAQQLGVTSGSFYWHFANRPELYTALLDYWEREMTDATIKTAKQFVGEPKERIWRLMEEVMTSGLARLDLAFWHWAQSDAEARQVFQRVLNKRFTFAAWMFSQAGFSSEQAEIRGRMMVTYMMGESTLVPDHMTKRKEHLRLKHAVLTAPEK